MKTSNPLLAEIAFLLPREDRREMERLAKAADRTLSAEVRRAVRLYLEWSKRRETGTEASRSMAVSQP